MHVHGREEERERQRDRESERETEERKREGGGGGEGEERKVEVHACRSWRTTQEPALSFYHVDSRFGKHLYLLDEPSHLRQSLTM